MHPVRQRLGLPLLAGSVLLLAVGVGVFAYELRQQNLLAEKRLAAEALAQEDARRRNLLLLERHERYVTQLREDLRQRKSESARLQSRLTAELEQLETLRRMAQANPSGKPLADSYSRECEATIELLRQQLSAAQQQVDVAQRAYDEARAESAHAPIP